MSKTSIPDNVRNVITIMTDQHRVDTIGCLGNPNAHTPNLDELGNEGFAFTNCFTPTAVCTPARTSLITGKVPLKHKVLSNPEWNIAYPCELRADEWTYTSELRKAGYNVGLVGKFHAGSRSPEYYGMDDDSFPGSINPVANERYQAWLKENDFPPVKAHDFWQGRLPGDRPGHVLAARLEQPEEATFERFIADTAIARIKKYAQEWKETGKPFCLDIHFYGPHLPYFLPDEYFDLIDPETVELPDSFMDTLIGKPQVQSNYATYWSTDSFDVDQWKKLIAIYRGYVAMIDFEIGRIMQAAKETGVLDDTAIFFTADHGEFTGAHRLNDKAPAMYDDIYNVPFIAKIPGVSRVGKSDALVSILDLPATVMEIARLNPEMIEDGRTLIDLVRGEEVPDWRQSILAEFHGHHFPLQQRMLRTKDYKLIVSLEGVNELYDLRKDPNEINNCYNAPAYKEVRTLLSKMLYFKLMERGDEAFARWLNCTTDYDLPLGGTSKSDWDQVEEDSKRAGVL